MKDLLGVLRELWHLWWFESDPLGPAWQLLLREVRRRQREREKRWEPPTQQEFKDLMP